MNILITSGTYHPEVGGPPTYIYALAQELPRRGHRLRVVTYGQSNGGYPYRISRVPRSLPVQLRLAVMTLAVLREGRGADLLFVNDYGLPPTVANLVLRKPLVMKIVGDFAWEYAVRHQLVPRELTLDQFQPHRYGGKVERLRAMQTWYARRANLIIVPSEYLNDLVTGWGIRQEKVRLIPNAPTPSPARPPRGQIRRELGLAADEQAVVTLARLAPWKGVDVLIRAMAAVHERAPKLRLLIVGDGAERAALEQLAAPLDGTVRFLGEVQRERALEVLEGADILALCSAYEGLSHVLLEGMAAGKPVVASEVGGNLELVRDEDNGLLVPYGDADALGAALLRLATEPALAARLAAGAKSEAEQHSWPDLVEATLAVFEEALERGRAARR